MLMVLLIRQTSYLQERTIHFLLLHITFSCRIAWGAIFRKMVTTDVSAYIFHFLLEILNVCALTGGTPFLAETIVFLAPNNEISYKVGCCYYSHCVS